MKPNGIDLGKGNEGWLTSHARKRCQQRGINRESVTLVERLHDAKTRVGDGCVRIWISRRRIARLRADQVISAEQAEAVANIALVKCSRSGFVVTAHHITHAPRRSGPRRSRASRARIVRRALRRSRR